MKRIVSFVAAWRVAARPLCTGAALALLMSCGGGGGAGGETPPPPDEQKGVFSGFNGDLDWEVTGGGGGGGGGGGSDGGIGGAADGDGGVGGGGDFGQFRNTLVVVKFPDGTELGRAPTDEIKGMVTIKPGKSYQGPLYVELQGGPNATYFEEGKGDFVPFPAGNVIRVWVPKITKNIGVTAFTDAGFRLLTEGSTPERVSGTPTAAQISAANDKVRDVLNQQFPNTLHVDDITRLPFIKSPSIAPGSIGIDPRGRYGLVSGAFSKQAAMFNAAEPTPTLAALKQFGEDMLDGKLDGANGAQPAVPADKRVYDAHTLTGELSSALAEQSFRFGNDQSKLALPKLLNFGNTRYEGYLFDASLRADGKAFDTVAGWVTDNSKNRNLGDAFEKLPDIGRTFSVFANHGHGSVFFKTVHPVDKDNSQSKVFAVGDNVNGELGTGTTTSTKGAAVEVAMPAGLTLTHIAGGFAHSVARFADGSVYAWGDNSSGQLGQGVDANALPRSSTPLKVNLPAGAIAVAASSTASYALLADGSVYSWGSNGGFGLLGDGNKNGDRTQPQPVMSTSGPLSGIVQIAARDNDAIVVRRDGAVLTWGSHPADADGGFTEHELGAPYRGGTPLPAVVAGLPQGLEIRKVLTEQGVFAALGSDGAVYTWGVYFDLTAQQILRDLVPVRVLGLPPVRDMMPGGFQGYGQRPFDRLTSTAIDDRGNMWKVRGRVAEQFDPDNPAQQRRPKGTIARPDCASCHVVLTDWPLTPPEPTSGTVCVPPTGIHGDITDPNTSLLHADTQCEQCHNPARTTARPSFTDGWLNCIRPNNLLPRPQLVTPTPDAEVCAPPAGHVFTPPGTTCSTCHNSVIARPLQQIPAPTPGKVCGQPPSSALPSLKTTATITSAVNDAGATIASGASTPDSTPTLQGTLSAALGAGQTVSLLRNGTVVSGSAAVNGTSWTFTDPGGASGSQTYHARVVAGTSFGPTGNGYTIVIDSAAPTAVANVTEVRDDVSGVVVTGSSTSDTTPTIVGSFSAAPGTGETVRIERNGAVLAGASVTVSGATWRFTEPNALPGGTYTWQARVVDVAGNLGQPGTSQSVTVITNLASVTITSAFNDAGATIAAGTTTPDTTPRLQGTISAALPAGQSVRVRRGSAVLEGSATVSGTSWTFTDPGSPQGSQSYTAFVQVGTVVGQPSAAYAIVVDSAAPTATANVSEIRDDILGIAVTGGTSSDSTPTVNGTVGGALAAGESVRLQRALGSAAPVVLGGVTLSVGNWTFTEPTALAQGTYSYRAQVIDAAGNLGALGTAQSVTINTTVRTAAITEIRNDADTLIARDAATTDTTPKLIGTLNAALAAGQTVRVLRDGQLRPETPAVTVTGTSWTYTDAAVPDGRHTYTARVDTGSAAGTPGSGYVITVDTVRPAQTISSFAGLSDLKPWGNIVYNPLPKPGEFKAFSGSTSDPTPTIRFTLSAPLAFGESVTVTRSVGGGTAQTVNAPQTGCGTNCLEFAEEANVASIPVPPNVPAESLPTVTYRARVVDAALNQGTENSVAIKLGYFECNQERANDAYRRGPPVRDVNHSDIKNTDNNCNGCHMTATVPRPPGQPPGALTVFAAGKGVLPIRGEFVAAPATLSAANANYWCTRP